MKHDFTSAQVGSMLLSAEMRHAGLVELKKYELKQLELAVDRRERAVFDKSKKVLALTKRQSKLRAKRDKLAPKPGKERTKRYIETLRVLRIVVDELTFCRNWIAQKERVLRDKRGKRKRLKNDIAGNRYRLCFSLRSCSRSDPPLTTPTRPPSIRCKAGRTPGLRRETASGGRSATRIRKAATRKSAGYRRQTNSASD